MQKLPKTLLQLIQDFNKFRDQMNFRKISKTSYCNIWLTRADERKFSTKLTDDILLKHPHIKYLDISYNSKITDLGIQHLQLYVLIASGSFYQSDMTPNITDNGIRKQIYLHTLIIRGNLNITDN